MPAGVVPYLVHPWVISNERLRHEGWTPAHGNAEAITEALAALPRRDTRPVVVAGAGGLLLVAGTAVALRRRRRKRTT